MKTLILYIEIYLVKILLLLNIKLSKKPIPKGTPYCYSINYKRCEKEPINGFWVDHCKYYRSVNGKIYGCSYIGFIGFDILLSDQCKICSEGYE